MSNIRLVKKDENRDNIRLGINQSYYNEVVRRLQNTNVNETLVSDSPISVKLVASRRAQSRSLDSVSALRVVTR